MKILSAILLLFAFSTGLQPAYPNDKPTRGDYPKCQEECLSRLNKRMTELSDMYNKTENKLQYEELVDQARDDYDRCITNCRKIYPVK